MKSMHYAHIVHFFFKDYFLGILPLFYKKVKGRPEKGEREKGPWIKIETRVLPRMKHALLLELPVCHIVRTEN